MQMPRVTVTALLALALAACGDEPDKQIGPKDPGLTAETAPAYFGVEACTCYEYKSTDPGEPRLLGVAVERVDDHYTEPGDRKDKHVLVYRLGSTMQLRYVLEPTETDLLMSRIYTGDGIADDEWRLAPHASWLRYPVKAGTEVSQKVEMSLYQNGLPIDGEVHEKDFSAIVASAAETITASLDGKESQPFESFRIEYFGTEWKELSRWFVPEVGNVKLELELPSMNKKTTWVLHNVRKLDASCPGPNLTDFCGTTKP